MNVSERIADWLAAQGLEQVFCVTGGGAMFLNQAFGGHPKLRTSFLHHEQACAMAAEGYARIAEKPAILNVTTGPGALNALNGVFGAFTDSIPMLVVSGQVKRETCLGFVDLPALRQLGDQEARVVDVVRPLTKWVAQARTPEEVGSLVPRALAEATRGRPGPAWLDIPIDIQNSTADIAFEELPREEPGASDEELRAACADVLARLARAHRPVILAGTGVRLAGAIETLRAFVERTGVPLATAWTHDLIESDHPLSAGRPGTIGTRAGNFCLQNADLVLVLGSRLNIRQVSYNYKSFAPGADVIQVDVDPAELGKPFVRPALGIVADVKRFLRALGELAESTSLPDYSAWAAWCREIQQRYPQLQPHQTLEPTLNPYALIDHVFARLRDDDIVVCGNATACIVPFQTGRLKRGQRLFSNSGSASMGYDLPAGIGAALAARGKRRVVVLAGDGSLQMNVQELQTLVSAGLDVLLIVLANGGYLSIRQTHENFFGKVVGATPASGIGFPDFAAVATAYGLPADHVRTARDLTRLDSALAGLGPRVVQVELDTQQTFEPRLKSRIDKDGKFQTPELDDMFPFLPEEELQGVRAEARAIRAVSR